MNLINRTTFLGLCFTLLIIISGCDDPSRGTSWKSTGEATVRQSSPDKTTLTIGDIDPDIPINRIRKIRPLADHLAKELGWDKASVNIRIARNIDELVAMLRKGEVDLFIDSSYPSVLVAKASGSGIFLESLVDGARTYQSVIIALASSNARELKHLGGSTIALQEEYRQSVLSPGDRADSTVIITQARQLMHDWLYNHVAETYALFADWDDRWRRLSMRPICPPSGS